MPVYEYKCNQCQFEFEKLIRSISAPPTITCEKCDSKEVEKLVSVFAFSGTDDSHKGTGSSSSCGSCTHSNCSTCHH